MQGIESYEAEHRTRTSNQGDGSPEAEKGTRVIKNRRDCKSESNVGAEFKDG